MKKLWEKAGHTLHPAVEKYTAGTDHIFDTVLLPFDIEASKVHAKALHKVGILTALELKSLADAFNTLNLAAKKGKVSIRVADEDCHTVIENYLVKKLGMVGKKIHAGRSRNDQVLVALRLYIKANLGTVRRECLKLATSFLDFAEKYKNVPMPGYSHTQQAMLSSVGHYFAAYAESLLDDSEFLELVLVHMDKNPLGSAAGFGTSIPVDREYTARALGFASMQLNTLYCQNSRGKFESVFLEGLAQIMMTLGKFANDVILFTSKEFDFFTAENGLTTGSSIMPQKRNLDVLELVRGNASIIAAHQLLVKELCRNLLSGYHRDFQLMKKPVIESVNIARDSIAVVHLVVQGLIPNKEKIAARVTPGIFAADVANQMVQDKGIPFRDAYARALESVGKTAVDMTKNLASKKTLGAPGNLQLTKLRKRATAMLARKKHDSAF